MSGLFFLQNSLEFLSRCSFNIPGWPEKWVVRPRKKSHITYQSYNARLKQLGANANADGTVTIVAPIAGTVADRETTVGESARDPGKKIMTIVNGAGVQASGNVFEKDLSQIKVGQAVRVKVNGLSGRTFNGRISVIGTTVSSDTRVVPIKVELDNIDGALKPGMFAEIEVLTDRTPVAVLAIPKSAIVETNDKKKIVFVQNGKSFQSTDITLGRESGDLIEVMNGLLDGDRIVTQRAPQLYTQSLRGDTTKPEAAGKPEAAATAQGFNGLALPWWALLMAGGAIVSGTFWAGMAWSSRRNRLKPVGADLMPQYETEVYVEPPHPEPQTTLKDRYPPHQN